MVGLSCAKASRSLTWPPQLATCSRAGVYIGTIAQHDVAVLPCSYRMDYLKFVEHHRATNADITIGCLPVDYERASDFGLMKIDDEGRIFVSTFTAHAPAIDLHPEPYGRLAGSVALQRHESQCLSPHVTVPSCEPPCDLHCITCRTLQRSPRVMPWKR